MKSKVVTPTIEWAENAGGYVVFITYSPQDRYVHFSKSKEKLQNIVDTQYGPKIPLQR